MSEAVCMSIKSGLNVLSVSPMYVSVIVVVMSRQQASFTKPQCCSISVLLEAEYHYEIWKLSMKSTYT